MTSRKITIAGTEYIGRSNANGIFTSYNKQVVNDKELLLSPDPLVDPLVVSPSDVDDKVFTRDIFGSDS